MYARIEYKETKRSRVKLRKESAKILCEEYNITMSTLRKYLTDIYNRSVTAAKRNEVVKAAINRYHGTLEEVKVYRDVLVIDNNDDPRNHIGEK